MHFLAADKAAPGGGSSTAPDGTSPATTAAEPVDMKARIVAALKLDAAATDDEVGAALEALVNKPADTLAPELRKLLKLDETADDSAVTTALIAMVEKIEGVEADAKSKSDAAIDLQLEGLEISDEAKTVLRETMIADPEKGRVLISAIPKKVSAGATQVVDEKKAAEPIAAVAVVDEKKAAAPANGAAATPAKTPATAKHDPAATVSESDKIAALDELIAKIRGEGKFTDYTSAREEARRQRPELFQTSQAK